MYFLLKHGDIPLLCYVSLPEGTFLLCPLHRKWQQQICLSFWGLPPKTRLIGLKTQKLGETSSIANWSYFDKVSHHWRWTKCCFLPHQTARMSHSVQHRQRRWWKVREKRVALGGQTMVMSKSVLRSNKLRIIFIFSIINHSKKQSYIDNKPWPNLQLHLFLH